MLWDTLHQPSLKHVFLLFVELIYCGQSLKDDKQLSDYGIQNGSTVHALQKRTAEPTVVSGLYWYDPIRPSENT